MRESPDCFHARDVVILLFGGIRQHQTLTLSHSLTLTMSLCRRFRLIFSFISSSFLFFSLLNSVEVFSVLASFLVCSCYYPIVITIGVVHVVVVVVVVLSILRF